jgi:vacuolar-type H+-ATPase subunit F/Vma7
MSDLLVIVDPELADGFRLAGARVWPATDAAVARDLVLRGLEDPDAGIIALADDYFAALDPRTRRLVERRYRPLVVALPARPALSPEQQRREYLLELIRRAVGFKIVLGGGGPAPG